MPSYTTNHVTSYITNLPVYQPAGKQTGKLEMYIIHGSMIQLWVNWQYILYLVQWFNYESINRNLLDYFDLKSILDLKMPSYTTNHVTSYITNLPVYQPSGKHTGKSEIHGSPMSQLVIHHKLAYWTTLTEKVYWTIWRCLHTSPINDKPACLSTCQKTDRQMSQ